MVVTSGKFRVAVIRYTIRAKFKIDMSPYKVVIILMCSFGTVILVKVQIAFKMGGQFIQPIIIILF